MRYTIVNGKLLDGPNEVDAETACERLNELNEWMKKGLEELVEHKAEALSQIDFATRTIATAIGRANQQKKKVDLLETLHTVLSALGYAEDSVKDMI